MRFFGFNRSSPLRGSKVASNGTHAEIPVLVESDDARMSSTTSQWFYSTEPMAEIVDTTGKYHVWNEGGTALQWSKSRLRVALHSGYFVGAGQCVGQNNLTVGKLATSWSFAYRPMVTNPGYYLPRNPWMVVGEGVCDLGGVARAQIPFVLLWTTDNSNTMKAYVSPIGAAEGSEYLAPWRSGDLSAEYGSTELAYWLRNYETANGWLSETFPVTLTYSFKVPVKQ